jgi:hypothetical protein
MAYFEALPQNFSGSTKENNETHQRKKSLFWPRFESCPSSIQAKELLRARLKYFSQKHCPLLSEHIRCLILSGYRKLLFASFDSSEKLRVFPWCTSYKRNMGLQQWRLYDLDTHSVLLAFLVQCLNSTSYIIQAEAGVLTKSCWSFIQEI